MDKNKLSDLVLIFYIHQKALASTSWMDGGGSGSTHSTRFELPMDLKTLEGTVNNKVKLKET